MTDDSLTIRDVPLFHLAPCTVLVRAAEGDYRGFDGDLPVEPRPHAASLRREHVRLRRREQGREL